MSSCSSLAQPIDSSCSIRDRVQAAFAHWEGRECRLIGFSQLDAFVRLLLGPDAREPELRQLLQILRKAVDSKGGAVPYEKLIDWIFPSEAALHLPGVACATSHPSSLAPLSLPLEELPDPTVFSRSFWSREQSELLGVSVAYLEGNFIAELDQHFGKEKDPDYYEINASLLHGPLGKGLGRRCPRDGLHDCSYVDALDPCHTGRATVMLSWCWQYGARTVVRTLSSWCRRNSLDPAYTYVWQCALCNNQYRLEARKAAGEEQEFEQFQELLERRVRCIGNMLVLLGTLSSPVCVERLWCLAEFCVAIRNQGSTQVAFTLLTEQSLDGQESPFCQALADVDLGRLRESFEGIRVHEAKATAPDDQANLLQLIDPGLAASLGYWTLQEACSASAACANLSTEIFQQLWLWLAKKASWSIDEQWARGEAVALQACANAAQLLIDAADWPQAERLLTYCRSRCETEGLLGTSVHAAFLQSMGVCLGAQCHHDEAMALYRDARSIYEAAGATGIPGYASLLRSMAARLRSRGHQEEAAELYRLARTPEVNVPSCSPQASSCSWQIDAAYMAARDTPLPSDVVALLVDRAETPSVEQGTREVPESVPERTPEVPSCSPQASSCSWEIDAAYMVARDTTLPPDVVALLVNRADTPSVEQGELLARAGMLMANEGRHEEALTLYEEAKAVFEAAGAMDSMAYAGLLRSMAARLRSMGRNSEAAVLYREAQAVPAPAADFLFASFSKSMAEAHLPTHPEHASSDSFLFPPSSACHSCSAYTAEVLSAPLGSETPRVPLSDALVDSVLQHAVADLLGTPRDSSSLGAGSFSPGEAPHTPPCTVRWTSPPAAATAEDIAEASFLNSASLSMNLTMSPSQSGMVSTSGGAAAWQSEIVARAGGADAGAGEILEPSDYAVTK